MENELRTNAVKLSLEEQYQIRKSIVRLSKIGKTISLSILWVGLFVMSKRKYF